MVWHISYNNATFNAWYIIAWLGSQGKDIMVILPTPATD